MVREITITPVLNGFVCKVGCQKVVFGTPSELARNIEAYYKNPEAVEKQFIAEAVNKMNEGPCCDTGQCEEMPAPTPSLVNRVERVSDDSPRRTR